MTIIEEHKGQYEEVRRKLNKSIASIKREIKEHKETTERLEKERNKRHTYWKRWVVEHSKFGI